jgi:hypothetical protein
MGGNTMMRNTSGSIRIPSLKGNRSKFDSGRNIEVILGIVLMGHGMNLGLRGFGKLLEIELSNRAIKL